jgi:putative glutamine amidotransferase
LNAPLIGLTTNRNTNSFGNPQFSLGVDYSTSIEKAGGIPVLIPLGLETGRIKDLVSRLDGVLFTGGGDILPGHYNGTQHPLVSYVDEDRDRVEFSLFDFVTKAKLPFLGICRGFQVINVTLGGSLFEDILDQRPDSFRHQYHPDFPRDHLPHSVRVKKESKLAEILGQSEVEVNSFHHQGIKELAKGLRPTAYAPDGIIEGFELEDYPFGLAVQWHPENLQAYPTMRALFQAFVQAA